MYYETQALFENEYSISCEQYVLAKLCYEKKCGILRNRILWIAIGLLLIAIPFMFIRNLMNITLGWIAVVAIVLAGCVVLAINLLIIPGKIEKDAEKEYKKNAVLSKQHKITLQRDTFVYENCCDTVNEYYSQTAGIIDAKTVFVIAVDTLGRMIVIPKEESPDILNGIFRDKFNRRFL